MQKAPLPQEILKLLEHKVFRCSWCAGNVQMTSQGKYEEHRLPNALERCPNSLVAVSDEELIAAVEVAMNHIVWNMAELLSTIEGAQKSLSKHKQNQKVAKAWLNRAKKANQPGVHKWISKINKNKKPLSRTQD